MNRGTPADDRIACQPWFPEAASRLHLRKGARVLMLTCATPDLCAHLLRLVSEQGHVTVLEPDPERAARADLLEHPGLAVISYRPEGTETFGQHDALLASPAIDPAWPMNLWGDVARRNLRPGGRLALDLPGVRHCEAIEQAWQEAGGDPEQFVPWNGPSETALAKVLRAAGLRGIEPEVSTLAVRFASPREAAAITCARLGIAPATEIVDGLQIALARRYGTNEEIDVLFRRSRVVGMR